MQNEKELPPTYLTKSQAAQFLSVSVATIYNWIKTGVILCDNPNRISKIDLEELKDRISSGSLNRLNNRANRSHLTSLSISKESLNSPENLKPIKQLINLILDKKLSIQSALYLIALLELIKYNEISLPINEINANDIRFKRKNLALLFQNYFNKIEKSYHLVMKETFLQVLDFSLPLQTDLVGIIYQGIRCVSDKSLKGAWYTPNFIVNELLEDVKIDATKFILDPCCGTGQFLLNIGTHLENPSTLFGMDLDSNAIFIASHNIYKKFPHWDSKLNLKEQNSLTSNWKFKNKNIRFDIIATNPPWGSKLTKELRSLLSVKCPTIKQKSADSFVYFVALSLSNLKAEGELIFLLPESSFTVATHIGFRQLLINQTKIETISLFGSPFKGVMSKVVGLKAKKLLEQESLLAESDEYNYIVKNATKSYLQNICYAKNSRKLIFELYVTTRDRQLLDIVYSKATLNLKQRGEWALGIVTGDNKRFIFDKSGDDREPLIVGSNIKPGYIENCENFMTFAPKKMQQVAKTSFYRASLKIVYKFISNKPVLAIDKKKRLTLNSVNCYIPDLDFYPPQLIVLFFNSSLYTHLFKTKFASKKILRAHLEELPLPLLSKELQLKFLNLYEQLVKASLISSDDVNFIMKKIDFEIVKLFEIESFFKVI